LPGFRGTVSVQDAGAQYAAPLLDVRDGARAGCAPPGGKNRPSGGQADIALTALDSDASRIPRMESNLSRLGLAAQVRCVDAAALETWWDGNPFDRVLLDAPCSASGVVRRHPDIKWLRKAADIPGFVAQQRRLLEALWKVLARGGKLLYVTCSIFSEEDRNQIDGFASRHPDARISGGMPGREGLLLPDDERSRGYPFAAPADGLTRTAMRSLISQ
jgi:16S rRNA (cytosine967-C5)-methyltransferase